jgi:hypothetical protein
VALIAPTKLVATNSINISPAQPRGLSVTAGSRAILMSAQELSTMYSRGPVSSGKDLTGLGRDTLQDWRTVAGMTVR